MIRSNEQNLLALNVRKETESGTTKDRVRIAYQDYILSANSLLFRTDNRREHDYSNLKNPTKENNYTRTILTQG